MNAIPFPYVGQSLKRREDFKFLTGKGRYVDDIKLPGMLYAAIARSPHAHAIIRNVELSSAKAAPGVRLVLAGQDLDGKIGPIVPNWILPGTKVPFRPVIATDRVRFVGECVALVVAETLAQAYDAVGLIDVEYEVLPAVTDEAAAIREDAPQLHENVPGNITTIYKVRGGDYAKAAHEADQVIQLRIANNRLIPTCMETRSILPVAEGLPFNREMARCRGGQKTSGHGTGRKQYAANAAVKIGVLRSVAQTLGFTACAGLHNKERTPLRALVLVPAGISRRMFRCFRHTSPATLYLYFHIELSLSLL